MAPTTTPAARRARASSVVEAIGLLALCYVPFLLSSPGRVSADSKQYLFLDPGRFLVERAPYLWDAHVGAGTVSHQHIGYLFPMGPWFWLFDVLGVPTWVAQRLWLGTVSLAAVTGARWFLRHLGLGRAGALAGALVYVLTPYQLAFTARASVLLLPWAGLPWLMGLTDRALARGGWRHPAAMALVILAVGSVNASSLILVGIGPVLWLLAAMGSATGRRAAALVAGRTALLGVGVSLWWIVALRVEAGYGLPVLHVTERLESVAATSSPLDVLRGLGNWFFYGADRLGDSIDQAGDYLRDPVTRAATYALPAVALGVAALLRWPHRGRFVLLVVAGTVVAVGAWPLGDPSPVAAGVAEVADTSVGLALRNTARAAPVVVLGLAGLLGAAVSAWGPERRRWAACAAVGATALVGLAPVARTGFLSDRMDREDPIPAHWQALADALDEAGSSTRVLELPGSNFAAHRWGNAVDPVLPGLMDRPHVAREVLPQGSVASALLVDALDRRLQEGTLDLRSIAPVARLLGAGDVVVRFDLQYERFLTPNPRWLWHQIRAGIPGLRAPVTFGEPQPNVPDPRFPMLDEVELRIPEGVADPPPLARYPVEDPVPILRTAPDRGAIVVSGDADGLVDAAGAGLVDGQAMVVLAPMLASDELARVVRADGHLVVTDSYRDRIQTWFYAIRDTRGPTEQLGETQPDPTGYDYRLDASPEAGPEWRTVVVQEGASVTATRAGGAPRPEDRAAAAFDADPATAWRVGGGDPTGAVLRIEPPDPVATDAITLVQPQDGPRDRVLTAVRLRVDDGPWTLVELDERSLDAAGQVVPLPSPVSSSLDIELAATTAPPFDPALANAVGFAEVRLGGLSVEEVVRVPVALLGVPGAEERPLDVVLTRLGYEPGARGRRPQEDRLRRSLTLPAERTFGLSGTARLAPSAPGHVLDEVLGTDLRGATVTTSGHLMGDVSSRGSRALDGDRATAWRPPFGPQEGAWLEVDLGRRGPVGPLEVVVRDDPRHSRPLVLRVEADGVAVGTVDLRQEAAIDGLVRAELPAIGSVRSLRLVVEEVESRRPVPSDPNPAETLPVAIVDLSGPGMPVATEPDAIDTGCQPLVRVDGAPVAVRITGDATSPRGALLVEPCDGPLLLTAGDHRIDGVAGRETGLDLDQLVLASGPDGAPAEVAPRGVSRTQGAQVASVDLGPTSGRATIEHDGEPFWLVLGQSDSAGWRIEVDGAAVGERAVVDGYANGWRVEPTGTGPVEVTLDWAPQRTIWVALGLSMVVALVCLAIVVRSRPARSPDEQSPALLAPWSIPTAVASRQVLVAAVGGLVLGILVATPLAGLIAAVVLAAAGSGRIPRVAWAAIPPASLVVAVLVEEPRWAWVGLAATAAAAVIDRPGAPRSGTADRVGVPVGRDAPPGSAVR